MSDIKNPGPGAYNHKGTLEVPSSKFGTSQRASLAPHALGVPGPGQHSPEFKKVAKEAPKYGFGSEKRDNSLTRNLGPGPGGYEIR